MKKSISIFFAFVYLLVSTGILLNVHYCEGKISSVGFSFLSQKACGCGIADDDGCCKNEQKLVKLNDAHKGISTFSLSNVFKSISINIIITSFLATQTPVIVEYISQNTAPPNLFGALYDLHCVYLI